MSRPRRYRRLVLLAAALTFFVQLVLHPPFSWDQLPRVTIYEDAPHPEVFTRQGRLLQSYYAPWIAADFARWNASGISKAMVDRAAAEFPCQSQKLRIAILNDTLWVTHLTQQPPGGWYPAELGGGWVSAKGRVPHVVLALLDTLRAHPGEIPDLEAVIHTHDAPLISESATGKSGEPPPPIFGYTAAEGYVDIPFPDFSYWGHEHGRLVDAAGGFMVGWEAQLQYLAEQVSAALPLHKRLPMAMWRGRVSADHRDLLRRQFSACPEMFKALRHRDQELFNVWKPDVRLHEACNWRYIMYLESKAWATNFKQKLACGSVVLAVQPTHFEFFSRALAAGVHYVEVPTVKGGDLMYAQMCVDIARQVKHLEAEFQRAGLPTNPSVDLKDDAYDRPYQKFDRMPPPSPPLPPRPPPPPLEPGEDALPVAAPAQAPAPAPAPGPSPLEQLTGLRKPLPPWDIAANGQEFLRRHVRMQDVRRYLADALIMYGSLVDFAPAPGKDAICYSGQALLAQFGFPFEADRRLILEAYPWLGSLTQPGCPVATAASPVAADSGGGTSPSAGDVQPAAQHQGNAMAAGTADDGAWSEVAKAGSVGGTVASAASADAAIMSAGRLTTGAGGDAVKAMIRQAAQTAEK